MINDEIFHFTIVLLFKFKNMLKNICRNPLYIYIIFCVNCTNNFSLNSSSKKTHEVVIKKLKIDPTMKDENNNFLIFELSFTNFYNCLPLV